MPAPLLRILIVEYFCAGGGGARLPAGLLTEAGGILQAAVEDFSTLPGACVLTLTRSRLRVRLAPPHQVRDVHPGRFAAAFGRALREVDAALVVAPERDGTLLRLTRAIERAGVTNLGSSAAAVRVASDKWLTHLALERAGVPQPRTLRVPARGGAVRQAAARVSGWNGRTRVLSARRRPAPQPGWIIKPVDGYACLGLSEVRLPGEDRPGRGGWTGRTPSGSTLSALRSAVRAAARHSKRAHILVQERCAGVDASVCLVGNGKRAAPLLLNGQRIARLGGFGAAARFKYAGGFAPLSHRQARAALEAARRVAEGIPGLRGYFGVDLILQENGVRVVDVNPRLTSSYLLLRRLAPHNPASWILEAVCRGRLPGRFAATHRVETWLKSSAGTSAASI